MKKIIGYIEVCGCIGIAGAMVILFAIGQSVPLFLLLRLGWIVPFGIIWGLRTIKQARQREFAEKILKGGK
jgi:hypothetical protein